MMQPDPLIISIASRSSPYISINEVEIIMKK